MNFISKWNQFLKVGGLVFVFVPFRMTLETEPRTDGREVSLSPWATWQ